MKNQQRTIQPQQNSSELLSLGFRKEEHSAYSPTQPCGYSNSRKPQSEPCKPVFLKVKLDLKDGILTCAETGQQFPTTAKGRLDVKKFLEQIARKEMTYPLR